MPTNQKLCYIAIMAELVFKHTWEAVNPGCNGALVGQVAGNPAFVLTGCTSNECGMEDQPVLWSVSTSLQGSETDKRFNAVNKLNFKITLNFLKWSHCGLI